MGANRIAKNRRLTRVRWLAAGLAGGFVTLFLPPGTAGAATIDHVVAVDVTLDSPGTSTVAAFDPALGTLTQVDLTIDVEVLVQACIENRQEATPTVTGSLTGSLGVTVPPGADPTNATATADIPDTTLALTNGTDDCTAGFDPDTGLFPAPVAAPDAAYAEQADMTTTTGTLTGQSAIDPFVGPGTVTIAHTPTSDSELAVPAEWDAVSVAVGSLQVEVTYTYTPTSNAPGTPSPAPAPGGGTGGTGGTGGLSDTGANAARLVYAAVGLLIVGGSAMLFAKHHRVRRPSP
jgi:hypothetical protein